MKNSPLHIEIALHFYYTGLAPVCISSNAGEGAVEDLVSAGLVTAVREEGFNTSYRPVPAALEVYVKALMAVPYPVNKWLMPNETEK